MHAIKHQSGYQVCFGARVEFELDLLVAQMQIGVPEVLMIIGVFINCTNEEIHFEIHCGARMRGQRRTATYPVPLWR